MTEPSHNAEAALQDPNLDSATLAQIARTRPDLHAKVLAHPNCYPELAVWITQQTPGSTAALQTAAPASGNAFTQKISQAAKTRPGIALLTLGGAALLSMLSLALPLLKAGWETINYFSPEMEDLGAGSEGILLLISFLVVLGFTVTALLTNKKWAIITAGITGIIAGLFTAYDANQMLSFARDFGVGTGLGTFLLLLFGVVLVAAGVVSLVPAKPAAAHPAPPAQ